MQRSCPTCGAETFTGARFCRRCGAPVRHAGDDGEVSPQAATVPLADEARTTDGLGAEEATHAADTTRVGRAELERLLRAQQTGEAAAPDFGRRTHADADPRRADDGDTVDLEATFDARGSRPGLRTAHPPRADGPRQEPDEELTISVPRPARAPETHGAAAGPPPAPADRSAVGPPPRGAGAAVPSAPASHAAPGARPRRRWPLVVAVCCAALLFVVAAAWLAARFWRRPAATDVSTQAPVAPPAADPNQLFEEKLAGAEALLAQGDLGGALAALREANLLVPSNVKAHRRLGELLLEGGARREAVEEFRAVTRHDPEDFTAWRQLAAAQFAEGLYRDAAESYRRVIELVGEQSADPHDLLSFADALRLSGRPEEARALYQRLSALPSADLAGLARQRLAELTQPEPSPTPRGPRGERPGDIAQAGETAPAPPGAAPTPAPPTPAPTTQSTPPPPAPRPAEASPAERYRRGVELWQSDRAAAFGEFQAAANGGNADANYFLGLSYVEGKDLRGLNRAALLAALRHFQLAQRGQHASQSRRYAQQLEREFDRVRKQ